jgi:small-conductance mechanosensitive channel
MINTTLPDLINNALRDAHILVTPVVGQIIAAVVFFILSIVAGYVVYHLFEHYFSRWAKKTATTLDDEIIKNTKRPIYYFVILLGFYYAVEQLSFLAVYSFFIDELFLIAEVFLIAFIITRVINVLVSWYVERITRQGKRKVSSNILLIFKKLLHVFVYIAAFLYLLYVNHVDLSGAVVGLGVTGIAIAFALQSILGDVFSAFSIYFDRPFEIGDYIIIGQYEGTVTHISMKSTRIKLLQGEELVVSNKEITGGSIRNFKKMETRRISFTIGVTYQTPLTSLKRIPQLIQDIIQTLDQVEFQRVHFKEFGQFSLNFEIVYVIKSPDYVKYLDIQQAMNFKIFETFEKEHIELAYPTQTIMLQQPKQQS